MDETWLQVCWLCLVIGQSWLVTQEQLRCYHTSPTLFLVTSHLVPSSYRWLFLSQNFSTSWKIIEEEIFSLKFSDLQINFFCHNCLQYGCVLKMFYFHILNIAKFGKYTYGWKPLDHQHRIEKKILIHTQVLLQLCSSSPITFGDSTNCWAVFRSTYIWPRWTSTPTSAPSTGCLLLLRCGWTSTELIFGFTLVTNAVGNRSCT